MMDWMQNGSNSKRKRPGTDRVMQQESKRYKSEKHPQTFAREAFKKFEASRAHVCKTR